jgi:small-conductance mechanosensitive channel
VLGFVLLLSLVFARALSRDALLRRDLLGAVYLFAAFVALRLAERALPEGTPRVWGRALHVLWMLAFAFGLVRTVVSAGLKVVRMRSPVGTPKILRDVIDSTLYALAALVILKTQLNLDLTGVVATSAVLSVVLGLALQDTLGNLFAGLSLQLERPFQVGDFVTIGSHTGRVVQIAWRATRIENFRKEVITLPNALVAKEAVKNFSANPGGVAVDIYVGLSYDAPPNQVKAAVQDVLSEVPHVLREPRPQVRTWAFDESGVRYQLRYWVTSLQFADSVMEEIYTHLWYRLRREGIEVPLPQRVVHTRPQAPAVAELDEGHAAAVLRGVDLFATLGEPELQRLQRECVARRFGLGEHVIDEGEKGHTFYVVARGQVSVRLGRELREVARLERGGYFGEMSLLTGEPRTATVVAESDAVLLELDRPLFARLFAEQPDFARQLSALLAQRRAQLRAAAAQGSPPVDPAPEASRIFGRLKNIFGLH